MKFVLEINLEEGGLNTFSEIAQALRHAGDRIDIWYPKEKRVVEPGMNIGYLRDHTGRHLPGSKIGKWTLARGKVEL